MPGLTPFGIRVSAGQAPALDPASLPNLLWYDDVASLTPAPAGGALVDIIPVRPGTPTHLAGISVPLVGTFGGAFQGTYQPGLMPGGAPAIAMAGAQYAHGGGAFQVYASSQTAPGMTLYLRFRVAGLVANRVTSLAKSFVDANGLDIGYSANAQGTAAGLYTNIQPAVVGWPVVLTPGGVYTLALVVPATGSQALYWAGQPLGTQPATSYTLETSNGGYGLTCGGVSGDDQWDFSAMVAYQAVHGAATVAAVTRWLQLHR